MSFSVHAKGSEGLILSHHADKNLKTLPCVPPVSTSKQVQTMTVEFAVDLGSCLSWRMPTGFACDQQLVPVPRADKPSTFVCRLSRNSGYVNLLES